MSGLGYARAVTRSAAATSIDARSATVRGLRSLNSRITSSSVTVAGSGDCCASAVVCGMPSSVKTRRPIRRTLLLLDFDRGHATTNHTVNGRQHEQRHPYGGDEAADDDHGERPLCFAADT